MSPTATCWRCNGVSQMIYSCHLPVIHKRCLSILLGSGSVLILMDMQLAGTRSTGHSYEDELVITVPWLPEIVLAMSPLRVSQISMETISNSWIAIRAARDEATRELILEDPATAMTLLKALEEDG